MCGTWPSACRCGSRSPRDHRPQPWSGWRRDHGRTDDAIRGRGVGPRVRVGHGPRRRAGGQHRQDRHGRRDPARPMGAKDPAGVGYVQTHDRRYLPAEAASVVGRPEAGQRTPVFLATARMWTRYSWYLRLPHAGGGHPWSGVVRCETGADIEPAAAIELADRVSGTLPRFASIAHKDPRAPQNLYPIGGLERLLRHRLGDSALLYRSLRAAAA